MEIKTRKVGKCKVLDCSGSITIGPAPLALRKAIREAVQDGASKVILNLKNVSSMDSSGLGEMISGHAHAANRGSKLIFLHPSKKIRRVIAQMKLLSILEFFDDEQKALEGCEQSGK